MEVIWRDWYCQDCSLQFDNKTVFDLHMSLVHKEKLIIKEEQNLLDQSEERPVLDTFKSETLKSSEASQKKLKEIDTKQIIPNEEIQQRPYSCKFCYKNFAGSYALKCHERIHTGKKPY